MVAKYYGKNYTLETLRNKSYITREGVSLLGTSEAAESIGFRTMGVKITFEQLVVKRPWKYKLKRISKSNFMGLNCDRTKYI